MDLHWPEPEFAKHLEQRLKLMASDMMEACVKRSEFTAARLLSPYLSHSLLHFVFDLEPPAAKLLPQQGQAQIQANLFLTWKSPT